MLKLKVPYFYYKSARSILAILLRSPDKKELEMMNTRFDHVCPEDHDYLIDMYFKIEMRYVLEKILFAHAQGSFTVPEKAA